MKKFIVTILGLSFCSNLLAYRSKPKTRPFTSAEINILAETLKSSQWSEDKLRNTFDNKAFRKLIKVTSKNLKKPVELTHNKYAHFMGSYAMNKANKFNRSWRTTLRKASIKYGVEDRIISSILLVETSYGTFSGKNPLFSVFASTYIDAQKIIDEANFKELDPKMQKRIKRKKSWSLDEMRALLQISTKYTVDLFELQGSYAGAFGICQFLPSSFLRWAVTRDGKGMPNLFKPEDAIFSVGNYLKAHGYQLHKKEKIKKAIWSYNNSDVYVDTVMSAAKKMKPITM